MITSLFTTCRCLSCLNDVISSVKVYNKKYVRWVEEQLAETLTTYTKPVEDGVYVRRSNKKSVCDPQHLTTMTVNSHSVVSTTNHNHITVPAATIFSIPQRGGMEKWRGEGRDGIGVGMGG